MVKEFIYKLKWETLGEHKVWDLVQNTKRHVYNTLVKSSGSRLLVKVAEIQD